MSSDSLISNFAQVQGKINRYFCQKKIFKKSTVKEYCNCNSRFWVLYLFSKKIRGRVSWIPRRAAVKFGRVKILKCCGYMCQSIYPADCLFCTLHSFILPVDITWHSSRTRQWPPNDFGKSDVTYRFVSLSRMPGSDFDFSLSITRVFWRRVVLLLLSSLLSFSCVYTDGIVCAVNFTTTIRSASKYATSIYYDRNQILFGKFVRGDSRRRMARGGN